MVVVAADWWIPAEDAAAVFAQAGIGDRVKASTGGGARTAVRGRKPRPIVSIDAFEYFGTADGYLPCLAHTLRPGGQLGIATPAMTRGVRELGTIPPHIKRVVGKEAIAWHTAHWWRFQ
ncbi:hypothetical protein ACIRU3_43495 [Streptomyces sp. NPDC101151]|uniref:hypothetical protein n=1 Tax=Streptomyces sp. NPDC101151 TaxID=3366115 RepID=UPI00382F379E